ncbi:hypothetical protein [Pseudomonas sp. NPDC089569]|uniref:hypothetical protein n=1 Tax=Pseudomonas sp. NPDC089569 TaxID=3390722 RepID=UPI003D0597B8
MKKTLIALALMSVAGIATAKTIEVQADVYSGKEFVKTYKAVVAEGASAEFKDKEVASHFWTKAAPSAESTSSSANHQNDEGNPEPGLTLKMTPRVLEDGQILMDAACSLTTAETAKVMHGDIEMVEPVSHVKSFETQLIASDKTGTPPAQIGFARGELVITFSAREVL